MRGGRRWFAVGGGALALTSACDLFNRTCPPGEPSPALKITIIAGKRLNRDDGARSLPTWVRVYQLTTAASFERVTFDDLWARGSEALGPSLLAVEERPVYPGERAVFDVARDEGARALGVAALFRRPTGASWRAIHPLARPPRCATRGGAPEFEGVYVAIEESSVRASGVDPEGRDAPVGGKKRKGKRR